MILVDTHVLLWLLTDDPRLGSHARRSLTTSMVHVSAISMLELTIKAVIGKLRMPPDLGDRLVDQGLRTLPFDVEHAAAVADFPALARHDPFDRALLAQASVERLRFVTADAQLLGLGLDWVVDASR